MLTDTEKKLLRESFEVFDNNRIEVGVWFMVRLFETVPGSQDLFPKFKGLEIDEIWTSKPMRGHALQVISLFANYIGLLDEMDTLTDMLLTTGARHYKHAVAFEYFEGAVPVFVSALEHFNKDAFTAAHKAAWVKAVGIMWPVIKKGLDLEKSKGR